MQPAVMGTARASSTIATSSSSASNTRYTATPYLAKATSVAAVTIVRDVTNVIWDAFSVRRVVPAPPNSTYTLRSPPTFAMTAR